jgi:hypothetical protein
MLDKTKGFPPYPGKPVETFLMHPAQHRRMAWKLEQLQDNPEAQYLAKHHRFLAKHIQEKLNAGTARIKGR